MPSRKDLELSAAYAVGILIATSTTGIVAGKEQIKELFLSPAMVKEVVNRCKGATEKTSVNKIAIAANAALIAILKSQG